MWLFQSAPIPKIWGSNPKNLGLQSPKSGAPIPRGKFVCATEGDASHVRIEPVPTCTVAFLGSETTKIPVSEGEKIEIGNSLHMCVRQDLAVKISHFNE